MQNMASKDYSFDAYWLAYLDAHRNPVNRMLHILGTIFGLVGGAAAAYFIVWWAILPIGIAGYSLALIGHFLFERNRPFATRPLFGLIADFRMIALFFMRKLDGELERAARLHKPA